MELKGKHVLVAGLGESGLAVSYTHLRAHETVLDLVCRLLLEKTKKAKTEVVGIDWHMSESAATSSWRELR